MQSGKPVFKAPVFNAIEITTERLVLKPVSPFRFARQTLHWTKDRQAMADLALKPDGWTFWRWWRQLRRLTRNGCQCHGIWLKQGGAPIGLRIGRFNAQTADVGTGVYVADPEWRRKKVAQEAGTAMLDDYFVRCGVNKITSWINAANTASINTALSQGFREEARLRQCALLADGTRTDYLAFGILREEWLAKRRAEAPDKFANIRA
ncbi:MAG: GNAT family protein [Rhizobiaceae bacterium]